MPMTRADVAARLKEENVRFLRLPVSYTHLRAHET